MVTQPHNTTGCVGGTAMFTCVMNVTVNIRTDDIKWWRKRIDNDSPRDEIPTQGSNLFSTASSINGGILTSVLIITNLRLLFIGPYWLEVADGIGSSDSAFLSIIPNGMYVRICILCMYGYMCLCGHICTYIIHT